MIEGTPMAGHETDKKEALGEVLNGDRLVGAPYKLDFKKEKDSEVVCRRKLSKEEVARFRNAVSKAKLTLVNTNIFFASISSLKFSTRQIV